MAENNNKADIDFEVELWKAVVEHRDAVAENQYKDYVLFLIFIKRLSDRYNIRRDQLLANCNDSKDDYYTTDKEEISYIFSDPEEHLAKDVYILPEEAIWENLQEKADMDDIKVKVDQDTRK